MGIREGSLTNSMCLSHQVLLKLHKNRGFFSARIIERTLVWSLFSHLVEKQAYNCRSLDSLFSFGGFVFVFY